MTSRSFEYLAKSLQLAISDSFQELSKNKNLQALYLAFAGIWFVNDLYSQLIPLLFTQIGISPAVIGLAWSLVALIQIVCSPIVGVIADEYDRMTTGAICSFILALLFLLFVLVDSTIVIVSTMLAVGGLRLLIGNTATASVSEKLPDEIAGIGWGLRDAFIYLGSSIGLAIGGMIVGVYSDIRYGFLALIPTMFLVGVLFLSRSSPTFSQDIELPEMSTSFISDILDSFREISDWNTLSKFIVVKAFVGFGMGGTMFLLPVFATDIGINASEFLTIFAASHFVGILMSLVGGIAANFLPNKILYVANFATEALMLLMFAFTTNIFFFGVAMALFVIQTAFEPAVIGFFFDQFDDEESGRAWSIDGLVSKGVSIIAPTIGGIVYGVDPRLAFVGGGMLTAFAAAVAITIS